MLILLCIAIPVITAGLITFLRSQYGDEMFTQDWPVKELNRSGDRRLIGKDPVRHRPPDVS